jgi:hypothetical protein
MSVSLEADVIRLNGVCRVEDAEPLLMLLRADPRRTVELTGAGPFHAAVVQVLLALRPSVTGQPGDPFATTWLMPLLSVGEAARQSRKGSALNLGPSNPRLGQGTGLS